MAEHWYAAGAAAGALFLCRHYKFWMILNEFWLTNHAEGGVVYV